MLMGFFFSFELKPSSIIFICRSLICISPFQCACFGFFFFSAHNSAYVFLSCRIHGKQAHDRQQRHRREDKPIRKCMLQLTFHFKMCVFLKTIFFSHFALVLNSFVEDATILCLYGYFSILYTHVDSVCTPYHIFTFFFLLLSIFSSALISGFI